MPTYYDIKTGKVTRKEAYKKPGTKKGGKGGKKK